MSQAPTCALASLDNPLLNGLGLGLQGFDTMEVSLQPQLFRCCEGRGFAWHSAADAYTHCPLKLRLRRVQELLDLYRRRWPQQTRSFMQVSAPWAASVLQELASTLKHDLPPARVTYTQQRQGPSDLWPRAVALNWRFGIEARVYTLGQLDNASLASFTAESEGPLALLVEQVDRLWDPMYAEALEFIIQRAYNAGAWLWLEVVHQPEPKPEAQPDHSLRASFSRRIAQLKSQHPLDSLSPDGRSRLISLVGSPWSLPKGGSSHA
jgi:hypothetical protein